MPAFRKPVAPSTRIRNDGGSRGVVSVVETLQALAPGASLGGPAASAPGTSIASGACLAPLRALVPPREEVPTAPRGSREQNAADVRAALHNSQRSHSRCCATSAGGGMRIRRAGRVTDTDTEPHTHTHCEDSCVTSPPPKCHGVISCDAPSFQRGTMAIRACASKPKRLMIATCYADTRRHK